MQQLCSEHYELRVSASGFACPRPLKCAHSAPNAHTSFASRNKRDHRSNITDTCLLPSQNAVLGLSRSMRSTMPDDSHQLQVASISGELFAAVPLTHTIQVCQCSSARRFPRFKLLTNAITKPCGSSVNPGSPCAPRRLRVQHQVAGTLACGRSRPNHHRTAGWLLQRYCLFVRDVKTTHTATLTRKCDMLFTYTQTLHTHTYPCTQILMQTQTRTPSQQSNTADRAFFIGGPPCAAASHHQHHQKIPHPMISRLLHKLELYLGVQSHQSWLFSAFHGSPDIACEFFVVARLPFQDGAQ